MHHFRSDTTAVLTSTVSYGWTFFFLKYYMLSILNARWTKHNWDLYKKTKSTWFSSTLSIEVLTNKKRAREKNVELIWKNKREKKCFISHNTQFQSKVSLFRSFVILTDVKRRIKNIFFMGRDIFCITIGLYVTSRYLENDSSDCVHI